MHFVIFFEIAGLCRVGLQTLLNLKHLVVRFSDNRGLRKLLKTKCEDLRRRGGIKASFLMEIQRSLAAHENMTVARSEYTRGHVFAKFIRRNSRYALYHRYFTPFYKTDIKILQKDSGTKGDITSMQYISQYYSWIIYF